MEDFIIFFIIHDSDCVQAATFSSAAEMRGLYQTGDEEADPVVAACFYRFSCMPSVGLL